MVAAANGRTGRNWARGILMLAAWSALTAGCATAPDASSAHEPALSPELAKRAAQLAVAACLDGGFATTALVAGPSGEPLATLSAAGASPRTLQIAPTKIAIVRRYGVSSSVIASRVATEPDLAAEIAADPEMGTARGGALLLERNGKLVGYIAVSGAPTGDQDETCGLPAAKFIAELSS